MWKHPQLIICEYFEWLKRQIDIYAEETLVLYSNDDTDVFQLALDAKDLENAKKNNPCRVVTNDTYVIDFTSIEQIAEPTSFWSRDDTFDDEFLDWNDSNLEEAASSEKTHDLNVHEYVNKKRQEMIDEMERAQKEALEYYETIKDRFINHKDMSTDEIESILFAKKYFLILIFDKESKEEGKNHEGKQIPYRLYLVQLDFYLNREERDILGYL